MWTGNAVVDGGLLGIGVGLVGGALIGMKKDLCYYYLSIMIN